MANSTALADLALSIICRERLNVISWKQKTTSKIGKTNFFAYMLKGIKHKHTHTHS